MTTSINQVIQAVQTAQSLIRAYQPVNPPYKVEVQAIMNASGDKCDQILQLLSEAQVMETGAFQVPAQGEGTF